MKIKNLVENKEIDGIYLISNVTQGITGTGAAYLNITLQDATGSIEAKKWDATLNDMELYAAGKVMHIYGTIIGHNGKLQIKIKSAEEVDNTNIDYDQFVICAPIPRNELDKEFRMYVNMVKDESVRALLLALVKKFYQPLLTHPAATRNHHEYCSGLLFHSVYCAKLCLAIANNYDNIPGGYQIDKDILIAGALMHDFGKIIELSGPIITSYTTEGRLIGHISIMQSEIREMAKSLNITNEVPMLLEHMILSHHGKREFGSPVLPMTKEALILSFADDIDAKLNMLDKALNNINDGEFTNKIYPLDERCFYRPKSRK